MPGAEDHHPVGDSEPSGTGEAPTGRHGLGPHVVGQRVVVRRLLRGVTGPSGGPAMTDVLGVCLAFSDAVVVAPDDGSPALEIALADVVSGKPVPARPSVLHRVDPAEAQRRGGALFRDLVSESLGAWTVRRSATATARRANSVLAFGPSGLDPDAEVAAALAAYPAPARPVVAVLAGSPESARFEAAGWGPESTQSDTLFLAAGVATVARTARRMGVDADGVPLEVDGLLAVARPDGATGVAVVEDRPDAWVGLRSIETDPTYRRRGLGRAVVVALTAWGAERGAGVAYLQVLAENVPARGLYAGLGFVEHHRYRYLAPS